MLASPGWQEGSAPHSHSGILPFATMLSLRSSTLSSWLKSGCCHIPAFGKKRQAQEKQFPCRQIRQKLHTFLPVTFHWQGLSLMNRKYMCLAGQPCPRKRKEWRKCQHSFPSRCLLTFWISSSLTWLVIHCAHFNFAFFLIVSQEAFMCSRFDYLFIQ